MSIPLPVVTAYTHIVNCGSCTECCKGDAIYMHLECGDIAAEYETEPYDGRTILKHKDNGDCIYLDREKGCTIWDRRPAICRELDCRLLLDRIGEKQMKSMGLGRVAYAAKRLKKNGIGSSQKD